MLCAVQSETIKITIFNFQIRSVHLDRMKVLFDIKLSVCSERCMLSFA